jgi:hypothetical protein
MFGRKPRRDETQLRYPNLDVDRRMLVGRKPDATIRDIEHHARRLAGGAEGATPAEQGLAETVLFLLDELNKAKEKEKPSYGY